MVNLNLLKALHFYSQLFVLAVRLYHNKIDAIIEHPGKIKELNDPCKKYTLPWKEEEIAETISYTYSKFEPRSGLTGIKRKYTPRMGTKKEYYV